MKASRPSAPFTVMAPFYDDVMAEVNYDDWASFIDTLLRGASRPVREVLDLACGTGNMTLRLAKMGYAVVGVDASEEMLDVARAKSAEGVVTFERVSFDELDGEERFDAVVSTFDALNNITRPDDLSDLMGRVLRVLRRGGAFVFDLNTVYGLREFWGNAIRVKEGEGHVSIWRTEYDRGLSRLLITLLVTEGGGFKCFEEEHLERGYDEAEVMRMLARAGFVKAGAYDGITLVQARHDSSRITYCAMKP